MCNLNCFYLQAGIPKVLPFIKDHTSDKAIFSLQKERPYKTEIVVILSIHFGVKKLKKVLAHQQDMHCLANNSLFI
jgi:hypothetical protein